jgi:hypothetical protein
MVVKEHNETVFLAVPQVVENVCPGLCTERYTLSPSQLRQHGKIVRSYSPTELMRMQLENRSSVVLSGATTENFLDIACMGSEEVRCSFPCYMRVCDFVRLCACVFLFF